MHDYTQEEFEKKYFTGPGNIENLYHTLNAIGEEANLDFGQGTRDEWLASFGYKRTSEDAREYSTLDGRRVGGPQQSAMASPNTQTAQTAPTAPTETAPAAPATDEQPTRPVQQQPQEVNDDWREIRARMFSKPAELTDDEKDLIDFASYHRPSSPGTAVTDDRRVVETHLNANNEVVYDGGGRPLDINMFGPEYKRGYSMAPNSLGYIVQGWMDGPRVGSLDEKSLRFAHIAGGRDSEAYKKAKQEAATMSDEQLRNEYNRISQGFDYDEAIRIGFANDVAATMQAYVLEMRHRDLGFGAGASPTTGEFYYVQAMQNPVVANVASGLDGMSDAQISANVEQVLRSRNKSTNDKALLMAAAAVYARNNDTNIDEAWRRTVGTIQERIAREDIDRIYQEERDKASSRGWEAYEHTSKTGPADEFGAARSWNAYQRAEDTGAMLKDATQRLWRESPNARAYFRTLYAQYRNQGASKEEAERLVSQSIYNTFVGKEVERMMPKSDVDWVVQQVATGTTIAALGRALTNLDGSGSVNNQLFDQAMSAYGEYRASKAAQVLAPTFTIVADVLTGGFVPAEKFATTGVQMVTKGLAWGGAKRFGVSMAVAENRILGSAALKYGGKVLHGALNFGAYDMYSHLLGDAARGELDAGSAVEGGLTGLLKGAIFGVVGAGAGKYTEGLTGKEALIGEAGTILAEGMTFSAMDYVQNGEITLTDLARNTLMPLGLRASNPGRYVADLYNRYKGNNSKSNGVRISDKTADELAANGYPEIARFLRDESVVTDIYHAIKGEARKAKDKVNQRLESGTTAMTTYDGREMGRDEASSMMDRMEEELRRMYSDKRVPWSVLRQAEFVLNGRTLAPTMAFSHKLVTFDDDGMMYGYTYDSEGREISRYQLKNDKEALQWQRAMDHECENNAIAWAENVYRQQDGMNMLRIACRIFTENNPAVKLFPFMPHPSAEELFNIMRADMQRGAISDNSKKPVYDSVMKIAESLVGDGEYDGVKEIREKVEKQFGVNIDEVLKKDLDQRDNNETVALDTYIDELTGRARAVEDISDAVVENVEKTPVEDAHDDGYNAPDEDQAGIKQRVDVARQRLRDLGYNDHQMQYLEGLDEQGMIDELRMMEDWEGEGPDAVREFLYSRAAYEGVIEHVQEEMERQVQVSDELVDQQSHQDTGMMQRARMKGGEEVFVVGGELKLNDDNTIDVEGSSDEIIVIDAANPDSEPRMISVKDLVEAEEPIPADQIKQQNADEIRQAVAQGAADRIDGVLPFNPGDTYTLPFDGMEHAIYIIGDAGDGANVIVTIDGGEQTLMPKQMIQDAADAQRQAEIDAEVQAAAAAGGDMGPSQSDDTEDQAIDEDEPAAEIGDVEGVEPMPMKGGEMDWLATTPERAHQYLYHETGLDEKTVDTIVENSIKSAEKELKKVTDKAPKPGDASQLNKFLADMEAHNKKVAAAQAAVDYWKGVKAAQQAIQQEQVRQRADEARLRDEAEAQAAAEKEAQRLAEQESARQEREALNGVPDWVNDTPADARARGYRNVNGERVDRQERAEDITGRDGAVKFSSKDTVPVKMTVIEADELQPSHVSGQRNPRFFLDEGQPKNRTDQASDVSAEKIAKSINPEEITGDGSAYQFSAPTVNERRETIQGHNRSDALKRMWSSSAYADSQQRYRQYLMDHADEFGMDPKQVAAMRHPVQVNVASVDDAEVIRLGQMSAKDLESGGIERIDPVTTARKLGPKMRNFAGVLLRGEDENMSLSELIAANGATAVKWLAERDYISPTQLDSAWNPTKTALTGEAKNDLQNILRQSLFAGGVSDLPQMFESMPAKAQKAILTTFMRDLDSKEEDRILPEIQHAIEVWHGAATGSADFAKATNYADAARAMLGWTNVRNAFTNELPAEKFSTFAIELANRLQGSTMGNMVDTFNRFYNLVQGVGVGNIFEDGVSGRKIPRDEATREVFFNKDIDNGQERSKDVVSDHSDGEAGQQGKPEDTAVTEQAAPGAGAPERGGRAESDDRAVAQAEAEVGTEPTEGQKEAGNYKKGHVKIEGFDITIEQPKGSVRSGVDASGKVWSQEMHNTYGYIRGTEGVDGDHIDVFLSDHLDNWNGMVYVVDQVNKDGSFDEHKVMYGFDSEQEARDAYLSNYEEGWTGLGNITGVTRDEFKKWVDSSHRKTKPFAEYKSVKVSRPIQGLEGHTEQDVTDSVRLFVEEQLANAGIEGVTIKGIALHGSRMRGDARPDSDLDVVVEYEGDISEDGLFNLLNEEPMYLEGKKVDINPITRGKSGTLEQYMERSRRYDEEKRAAAAEATEPVQSTDTGDQAYTITPTKYTTKKNKELDVWLVKFSGEIDKKQATEIAKETRGWWDREQGGYLMRSEEAARDLAERIAGGAPQSDAIPEQPAEGAKRERVVTIDDLKALNGVSFKDRETGDVITIHPFMDKTHVAFTWNGRPTHDFWNNVAQMLNNDTWGQIDAPETIEPATPEEKKPDTSNEPVQSAGTDNQAKGGFAVGERVFYKNVEHEVTGVNADGTLELTTNTTGVLPITHMNISPDEVRKPGSEQSIKFFHDAFVDHIKQKGLSVDNCKAVLAEVEKQIDDLAPELEGGTTTAVKAEEMARLLGMRQALTEKIDSTGRVSNATNETKQEPQQSSGTEDRAEAKQEAPKRQRAKKERQQEGPKQEKAKQEKPKTERKRVVSDDRMAELKERLRKKLGGQVNVGVDPELLAIGAELAVGHIERGLTKFADYAKAMIEDIGDVIRPYLKSFYNAVREMPEAEEYADAMTPYDEVRKFDIANFDKEGPKDVVATAKSIVDEQKVEQDVGEIHKQEVAAGELKLRAATEEDIEAGKQLYHNGEPVFAVMVTHQGHQTDSFQFTKPHITSVLLTNGKYVAPGELQVAEETDAKKAKKTSKNKKNNVSSQQVLSLFDLAPAKEQEDQEAEETKQPSKQEDNGLPRTYEPRAERLPADSGNTGEQVARPGEATGQAGERADREGEAAGGQGVQRGLHDGLRPADELEGPSPKLNQNNNHVERGKDYAPKDVDARIEANIAAIELMKKLLESGKKATPKEMSVLRKFSGWGGLGKAFNESAYGWREDGVPNRLRKLLGEEGYQQAVMSRNSAYYTPAKVIDIMWDIARALGFKGGNVLEGSAGIGNILGLMPTDMSERSRIHAVEIDSTTGNILKLLYPDAKVEIQGFEETRVQNGTVDLSITNVPFVTGLHVIDTSGDKDLSKKFRDIHDFCIAKNVRKLREGGIGIFITSSGTLDNSQKLRDWLVSEGNSDVVGAFRLNNSTFGGTAATSDIIVVRKRVNGQKSPNAIDVSTVTGVRTVEHETGEYKTVKGKQVAVTKPMTLEYNRYFVEHPEMMGGEMAFGLEKGETYRETSKALYPKRGINQDERLRAFVEDIAGKDWSDSRGNTAAQETATEQPVYEELGEGVKEGSMLVDGKGQLCVARYGQAVPLEVNANKVKGRTKAQCFQDYCAIKDAVNAVLDYQTEHDDDADLQPLLDKLNKVFDDFVNTYGHFHKNTALSFLKNDMDFSSIAALEDMKERNDEHGKRVRTFKKSDIFNKRVVEKETEPKPTTIKDGVVTSIYKFGRVDVPYISEQLGMGADEVKATIVQEGLGFENPMSREIEVSYEYLSGNVREKLRQAIENNEDGQYDANVKALEAVIPMNIPAHLIEFTLGSSWLDPKLYSDFIKERTGVNARVALIGGTWIVDVPGYYFTEQNRAMGVESEMCDKVVYGHELIAAALQNKTVRVSKTTKFRDGGSETIVDKVASQACATKIDEIRQDFKDWAREKMQSDPEMSAQVEEVYNESFNNYVPREIPDSFVPDYFGGASHHIKLRPHQAKAAIRATTQNVMLAHEVGTGKTFTLITTAMEMRRLGTARKPMIVVQNATVGQFVASAKELYPKAKVLTLEDADRTAEGRKAFYAKIKYNDWDMIVIPQSAFEMIPDSEERQMNFVRDKIDEKMLVLEQMEEAGVDTKSMAYKQAEREVEKLEEELNIIAGAASEKRKQRDEKREAKTRQNAAVQAREMLDRKVDDVEDFDQMGIDAILVDEAHEYKHLGFATAMQRGVKGVDPSYSKKSQGVFLKCQSVMERTGGKNVVFATGTPISNTAAEIWTFMRYLMPAETLKDYGIYYFDDFVRNFGNITQMLEHATNGKFKENNRFAGYVNLPELVRIWSGVADTVLTDEASDLKTKIPEMEGGKAQDIYLPQTRALRSVMRYVIARLEEYDKMSGKEKKANSHIPLTMYGIAKAAAVDARLVLNDAEDEPNSKTNETVRQTLRTLEETASYRGTVAIFADNYQNKQSGFNLYEDIRKKLIDAGVPADQIVVMKSGMSVNKKLEIFDKVNAGEIRVIMGSTFTLGTGVNIQERLHTLIHVDAPNRPMDYTQRNGRILRQGNIHKEMGKPVRVLRFGVEDSLDVTAYQRLKTKGAIADSIMHGKAMMSDSMENRTMEEEEDVFGDVVAQLSGSEYALLKNQVEREVRKLEAKRKQYEADQIYIHSQKPRLAGYIRASRQAKAEAEAALKALEGVDISAGITVGKQHFNNADEMGDFIKEYNKKITEDMDRIRKSFMSEDTVREMNMNIGGFDFVVRTVMARDTEKRGTTLSTVTRRTMSYTCEALGLTEPVPVKQGLLRNAIEDIMQNVLTGKDARERVEAAESSIARNEHELEVISEREGRPFEQADELKQAMDKLKEYEQLMKAELEAKEAKYADIDASVDAASPVEDDDEDEMLFRDDESGEEVLYREREGEPPTKTGQIRANSAQYTDGTEAKLRETLTDGGSLAIHQGENGKWRIEGMPGEYNSRYAALDEWRERASGNFIWYESEDGSHIEIEGEGDMYQELAGGPRQSRDTGNRAGRARRERLSRQQEARNKRGRRLIDELAEKLGFKPRYLEDMSEEELSKLSDRQKKSKGWYDPKTGEIYINLSRHTRLYDILATFLHETVAHKGLRRLFGKDFDTFIDNVYNNVNKDIRAEIDRMAERLKGKASDRQRARHDETHWKRVATEEYMAKLAERLDLRHPEQLSIWQQIRGWLINALRRVGVKFADSLSDNDLRGILWESYHNMEMEGVVGVAEGRAFRDRMEREANGRGGSRDIVDPAAPAVAAETQAHYTGSLFDMLPQAGAWARMMSNMSERELFAEIAKDGPDVTSNYSEEYDKRHIDEYNRVWDAVQARLDHDRPSMGKAIEQLEELNSVWYAGAFKNDHRAATMAARDALKEYIGFEEDVEDGYVEPMPDIYSDRPGEPGLLGEADMDLRFNDDDEPEDQEDVSGVDVNGFDAGRMTFEESITAGMMKAANTNRASLDARINAMRRLGGNLSKLRQAMSYQREYDRGTVDSIIRLARSVMDSGFFRAFSPYEVKRLMSMINNAAGREDITKQAGKVVDLLIKHQLLVSEIMLYEQLRKKGSKVNASGVDVQAGLDIKGQRMVAAMRSAMDLNEDALNERIEDCLDRLGSRDQALSDNAASEYEGLMLAKMYQEKITESKNEENIIRQEMKKAKTEYRAGLMTRDEYRQYVAEAENTLRENRLERVEAYDNLTTALGAGIAQSVERARAWREEQKERVRDIQHNANSDLEGLSPSEHGATPFVHQVVNNPVFRFFLSPMPTFSYMMRLFGRKHPNGEGYLFNRFMRGWVDADEVEWKNIKAAHQTLDDKVKEVFGRDGIAPDGTPLPKFKLERWSDLFTLDRKLPGMEVEFWDAGEKKVYQLSQGNLLYIYMVNKMSDGRMKLRKMGITEEDVETIRQHIDPRFIELADWLQNDYLTNKRNDYNAVHERLFGASMAAIENYFPLKVNDRSRGQDIDISKKDDEDPKPSTITGSIIKRKRNSLPLDVTRANAFDVILEHIQNMEHWAAFAEWNRDINTLLSYKRFRNRVLNMATMRYGAGKKLWINLKKVCAIAGGVYRPKADGVDKWAVNLSKGVTVGAINYRLYTAIKQLASYPAYLSEANPLYLLKNTEPSGAVRSWNWAIENLPGFARRWQSRQAGDSRLRETDLDWRWWRNRVVEKATRSGMKPNALVDGITFSMGARSIYETKLDLYRKAGYSEGVAQHRALQDASISPNETQQSSANAYLSPMQLDRTLASTAWTVFRNASMGYQRRLLQSITNLKHMLTPGSHYRTNAIEFMTKQMMRDGIEEEQAKRAANRIYLNALAKNAGDVAIFGWVMQYAWYLMSYLPYLIFGSDDDKKKEMERDARLHARFGPLEGLTMGNVMSDQFHSMLMGDKLYNTDILPLPFLTNTERLKDKFSRDTMEGLTALVDLAVQIGVGVNPQVLSDFVAASVDAARGDLGLARESMYWTLRVMQIPQSQLDELYLDELQLHGKDIPKMSATELTQRYVEYKMQREAPGRLLYKDSGTDAVVERYTKRFVTKIGERVAALPDKALVNILNLEDTTISGKAQAEYGKRVGVMDGDQIKAEFERGDSVMRKVVGSEYAKRIGAEKDTYGQKSHDNWNDDSKAYWDAYQNLRTTEDINLDVAIQNAIKRLKNTDEARAKEIDKARTKINDQIKKQLGHGKDDKQIMKEYRQARRELMQEYGIEE